MADLNSSYPAAPEPVRLVSQKTPLSSRLARVRVAWFVLGCISGSALSLSAGKLVDWVNTPTQEISAPAPEAEEEKQSLADPKMSLPASMSLRVGRGDTLLSMLTDTGVEYEEAHSAVQAIRSIYDPKRLGVGQNVALHLDESNDKPQTPIISSITLPISKTATVELTRADSGKFSVKKIEAPMSKKLVHVEGVIKSSFYETGQSLGIPASLLNEIIKVYSYDVDFQRDIKRGNKLEVVFERMQTDNGQVVSHGNILFASLDVGGRKIPVYRYTDKTGNADYYNIKGESLRKALLRTPINGAKITSGYGMRMHPLLGYSKMHRGADFGAATGTPIYAAGDGVVDMAGPNSSYGNYVRIKHNDKYATAYAHASRIASGIKKGAKVKQGQVIAYVGSTGRSTGPHLHYEVLVAGTQVNPAGVKFKTGNTLAGKELASFKSQIAQVQALVEGSAKKQVADNVPAQGFGTAARRAN